MPERPLLILKAGEADDEVRRGHGDFEDWLRERLVTEPPIAVEVAEVSRGADLPHPDALAAAVVTGSSAMVTWREPWMEETARWLAAAAGAGLPVLGICFGHQLLAHGLGGVVAPNPRGREVGTALLELLPAAADDPLFCRVEAPAAVQTTHLESVVELPPRAVHLAGTPGDPHQAFRWGSSAWGLQFHPEFSAEVMRAYIRSRTAVLRSEGLDVTDLLERVRPSDTGSRLLGRFAALAAERSAA